jgi:hypothetical protein
VRSAMHHAGARALTELLRFPAPDQRVIPCACGQQARYRELRSKSVLTAVGPVEVSRPWYLCPHCHHGQVPADQELDIVDTEFSPGVRRMQALVGQEAAFDHGREQMKLLAGLEVLPSPWNAWPKPLAPTLRAASNMRSSAPCNWIFRSSLASPFPFFMSKWMAPAGPW